MNTWLLRGTLAISLVLVSACEDSEPERTKDAVTKTLAIVGKYFEDYDGNGKADETDGRHEITETTWSNGGAVYHIREFDNGAGWLVAENDAANKYNPGKFSRFDWVSKDAKLFYCQGAYDAEDEAAAKAADSSDHSDLDKGCGGMFAWSELIKE